MQLDESYPHSVKALRMEKTDDRVSFERNQRASLC